MLCADGELAKASNKIVDSPADEGVNKVEGWSFVEKGN